jgi:hypothetical protein
MTEEWGELNINWHLQAFGAFYTPFWAAYDGKRFSVLSIISINYTRQGVENI